MSHPCVSIVVPIYNAGSYLRDCLDSICGQSFQDFEVICVDDGSTDGSKEVIREYEKRDARIRGLYREHTNAGSCRNVGLELSKGAYLLFLDSDDIFSSGMVESLVSLLELERADVASCGVRRFVQGSKLPKLDRSVSGKVIRIDAPGTVGNVFSEWVGCAWDKMFRKTLIDMYQLRFQEIRSTNDARFTYSALSLCTRAVKTSSVFVAHRDHPDSL